MKRALVLGALLFALAGVSPATAQADSIAYILGGYAAAPDRADIGKFTLTLVRRSGRWQIVSDMDSSNHQP